LAVSVSAIAPSGCTNGQSTQKRTCVARAISGGAHGWTRSTV
jgi:hypothetical protein